MRQALAERILQDALANEDKASQARDPAEVRKLEGWAADQRAAALKQWLSSAEDFEQAAESFRQEGRIDEAARCLVRAAQVGLGLPLPARVELAPRLLELPEPSAGEAADATRRALRLEDAARRLRKAAELFDAAGRPADARQQRDEALRRDQEAASERQRAARGAGPPAAPVATPAPAPAPAGQSEGPRRELAAEPVVSWKLFDDALKLADVLAPDLNFPDLPVPEPRTQNELVDGVADELQFTPTLADRRFGPGLSSGLLFASLSPASRPGLSEGPAAGPGFKVFFSNLGSSTGEVFEAHIVGSGPLPTRVSFDGLVVEPLAKPARGVIEQQIRKLAGGSRARARVDGYCLQFLRLPPEAGMVFQAASGQAQRAGGAMRRILRAGRRLYEAGRLSPDSDPTGYFHSIRQWALWTHEQGFAEPAFVEAFVKHTRRNLEAGGRKWDRELEPPLRQAARKRWQDIQLVLAAATAGSGPAGPSR